ncbi:MAG: cytochrome c [Methylophaga sp.]|nr:cytochrome c [Methylophaga sp.]
MSISNWMLAFMLGGYIGISSADTPSPNLGQPAGDIVQQSQWHLTILPNGSNLPAGSGNAAQGEQVFAAQCAACHGPAGIGGSALALTGEVGSLTDEYPEKTVNSYWPYATTLFDYIRRTMPPQAPYSLNADEVYALTAYILSQDAIIDRNLALTQDNLPMVTMPNRDGFYSPSTKP